MPQPNSIGDIPAGQTVKFGTQAVTFSSAGALIAEEIDYKKPMRVLKQYHPTGVPFKAAFIAEWGSGTAIVQCKISGAGNRIQMGETFNLLDTDATHKIHGIITEVGARFTNRDVVRIPISFSERINFLPGT